MKKILLFIIGLGFFISCNKEESFEKVTACFNFEPTEISGGEVKFNNCSKNATDYFWDFGDGTTSTKESPIHKYSYNFPFEATLIASNKKYSDTIVKKVSNSVVVKKPNIYLYPTNKMDICVKINFPAGGKIVKSIPIYKDGWCINVDKSGKIDDKFDYLFYESEQPNKFQYERGWCVKKRELEYFFFKNMKFYGFSDKEISDFIEYWIPILNKSDYYMIYPQTNSIINKTNILSFSDKPDEVFRLFYAFKGIKSYKKIKPPHIYHVEREGFYVVEWGGFIY